MSARPPLPRVDQPPWWLGALGGQLTAAWLVVRGDAKAGEYDVPAFAAFVTQLGLTAAWLLLFLRLRRPGLALVNVVALWLATALTVREFARKHRGAALIMLPWLGWVSYAGAVNAAALLRRTSPRGSTGS